MNRAEVAQLLAYAAAFDKRTIGDADVLAWYDVLDRTPYEPAKAAVREWYREHPEPVTPAHIHRVMRGSEVDRSPAYRPLREAIAVADAAAGGRMPALPAGAEGRIAVEEARVRLAEALDLVAAKRVVPADSPTGYVPKRQRGPVRRDQVRRLPAADRSGRRLTVCHRCACDIPAPDGWDATDEDAPKLYCGRCRIELGEAS